jgi:hypothetical protein
MNQTVVYFARLILFFAIAAAVGQRKAKTLSLTSSAHKKGHSNATTER